MRKTVALTLVILMLVVALSPIPGAAQGQGGGGIAFPIDTAAFVGTFTVRSFRVVDNAVHAVGIIAGTALTGDNAGQTLISQISVPIGVAPAQVPAQAARCDILNLTLGPLALDLLGLNVVIPTPIVINIFAEQGPGNLLGNLLCAITNLLNPGGGLPANLQQLVAFLNRLLGLL